MKITCTRPNASEEINGIPFTRQKDGSVVASGVSDEDAALFADFEGYSIEDEKMPTSQNAPAVEQSIVTSQTSNDVAPVDAAPAADAVVAEQAPAEAKPAKRK